MFDFNHNSAVTRSFGETEQRLVICIDFTVALVLHVGTLGDGDILVLFYFDRFENWTMGSPTQTSVYLSSSLSLTDTLFGHTVCARYQ